MAKIPQGILGGLRGRIGNVIGASWKGINYIRSMPLSVANPQTAPQQAQRGAFTQCVLNARLLLSEIIASYWDPFARYMSGYNWFISINIDAFTTAGFTSPDKFYSARGILMGVADLAVISSEGAGTHSFAHTDNTGKGDALATDVMVLLIYNTTQDYWVFTYNAGYTRDGTPYSIADADFVENDVIECYAFFMRPDLEKISDSSYYQETAVA